MGDKALLNSAKLQIAAIKRDRAILLEQIRQGQETIARSHELLKRIDAILEKAGETP